MALLAVVVPVLTAWVQQADYEFWQAQQQDPNSTWDYATCLKYFMRTEHNLISSLNGSSYHGQDGPLFVSRAVEQYAVAGSMAQLYAAVLGLGSNADYNGATQQYAGERACVRAHKAPDLHVAQGSRSSLRLPWPAAMTVAATDSLTHTHTHTHTAQRPAMVSRCGSCTLTSPS